MVFDCALGHLIIQQLKRLWQFCNIKVTLPIESPVYFSAFLTEDMIPSVLETTERLSLVSLVVRTGMFRRTFIQSTHHSKSTALCCTHIT